MDNSHQQACLSEIWEQWRAAGEGMRPCTAWIAEHQPIPQADAMDFIRTSVANAWLLTDHGVERRRADEYVRFITVQSGHHWASDYRPPASGIFNNRPGSIHTIGVAAFAPIADTDLISLEVMWGGLFGRGVHYRFDAHANALECVQNIWIS